MVMLLLCGDVMLGRGIDQILASPCHPKIHEPWMHDARDYVGLAERASGAIPRGVSPDYPWGDALATLERARPDARIVNLETAITHRGAPDPGKQIHYRVSPANAACLSAARIDACALANNHVLDWGREGLLDTLTTLDRLRIGHSGAGRDLDEAIAPAVIELGERGRVVVLSVGCVDAGIPPAWSAGVRRPGVHVLVGHGPQVTRQLRDEIARWRRPRTVIVLSVHWGPNWGFELDDAHRRLAHRLIEDAGVDVVHGHSSHHVKGIEVHRGRLILYGCGDLISDYEGISGYAPFRGELGLLYLASLDERGALERLDLVPTRVRRFQISAASEDDVAWLAGALARSGATLGTAIARASGGLSLVW